MEVIFDPNRPPQGAAAGAIKGYLLVDSYIFSVCSGLYIDRAAEVD